jgi:hypothetical protein
MVSQIRNQISRSINRALPSAVDRTMSDQLLESSLREKLYQSCRHDSIPEI